VLRARPTHGFDRAVVATDSDQQKGKFVVATLSDRALTALAMLMVNQREDQAGSLAVYSPFVCHCLAKCSDGVVSTPDLQQSLKDEWGVELPQAVINRILKQAEEKEKIVLADGAYQIDRPKLEGDDLSSVRADVDRSWRELLDGIRAFAKKHFELDWSEQNANDALQRYTDAFSSRVLAAAVTGGDIQGGPPTPIPTATSSTGSPPTPTSGISVFSTICSCASKAACWRTACTT
jgi:hypothetical protein